MIAYSRFAGKRATKGFLKIADILCPGDQKFPKFSDTGLLMHIDRVLQGVPTEDRNGLLILVGLMSFLPSAFVKILLKIIGSSFRLPFLPDSLKYALTGLHFGLRGIIFSMYYGQFPDSTGASMDINNEVKWKTSRSEAALKSPGVVLADRTPGEAMAMARKAQVEIESLGVRARVQLVKNLRHVILNSREKIIKRLQEETQKSKTDALLAEIFSVLDSLAYFEKVSAKQLADRKVHTPIALMGKKSLVSFDPLGVILVISPWNYPIYQSIIPSVLAFLCGNAVLFKPSEITPLKGLIEELLFAAGFEPSWIQVMYGDGALGAKLIESHPDKIFFTGSVGTGKKIMAQASSMLIPVELELGGKDPMIVFDDVNIKRAARGALWGGLTNCGQACTSVERIYVQASIYDQFKTELVNQMQMVTQSVDQDGGADIGYMTTHMQAKTVLEHVQSAQSSGATFIGTIGNGLQLHPVLIEGLKPDAKALTEESFGPLLPLVSFETESEAVELANDSEFGLSASVWSKDLKRAYRVAKKLQTGNVSINNVMLTEGNPALPFGGVKNSGFGRYKGEFGFYSFTNIKSILIDKDSKKIEANWYPYTKEKYQLFDKLTQALFGTGGILNFLRFAITGIKLEGLSQKSRKTN